MKLLLFLALATSLAAQTLLEGPWRTTRQDSPSFALPSTPDSDWAEVQIPWKDRPANGIFWLRKTITLDAPLPEATLVLGRVAASYEVYVNGRSLGGPPGFGTADVEPWQARQFRIPDGLPAGRVSIALRCWESKVWWTILFFEPGPYRLGTPAAAEAALEHFGAQCRRWTYARALISAAQVSLGLYLLLVWRRDLFWLGIFLASWGGVWVFFAHWREYESHVGLVANVFSAVLALIGYIAWSIASMEFLEFSRRTKRILIPALCGVSLALCLLTYLDLSGENRLQQSIMVCYAVGAGLAILRLWQRTYVVPSLLVLAASLVSFIVNALVALFGITAGEIQVQGISIPFTPVAYFLIVVWMSVEYLERLKRQRAERDRLAAEMGSARAVQSSLLSINSLTHAGYHAEAVYQPSLEVGGDFYELIAAPDGALLAVVGDVSGKGLQAAMVVALALGALRNRHASTPAALLEEMNRSLVQRKAGGFVTCVIARIEPTGHITVASAGHPSPCIAGPTSSTEWTLPPAFPSASRRTQPTRNPQRTWPPISNWPSSPTASSKRKTPNANSSASSALALSPLSSPKPSPTRPRPGAKPMTSPSSP